MFAFGPKKLTRQPAQKAKLRPEYLRLSANGFSGPYLNGNLGTNALVASAQFTAIQTTTGGPDGVCQSSNSATDAGGTASLSISASVNRNDFTFIFVGRVRAFSGGGVGARCNTDNIFLRGSAGNYSIRVNGVDTGGPAFPLNKWIRYVLTSSPNGISLWVNGALVLSAAASASATNVGVATAMFEDASGGGAMDADCAMTLIFAKGVSRAEAKELSINPWQVFDGPAAYPLIPTVEAGGSVDATVTTNQGQSAAAAASVGVDAATGALQGQSVVGASSVGVTGIGATEQGQSAGGAGSVGVDGVGAVSQGQSAAAASSAGVAGTGATEQGQSVAGTASIAISAANTSSQGQTIAGTAVVSADASATSSQGQTAAATMGDVVTVAVSTSQGQSSTASSEVSTDAPASAAQGQTIDAVASIQIACLVDTSQGQKIAGVFGEATPDGEIDADIDWHTFIVPTQQLEMVVKSHQQILAVNKPLTARVVQ
jgi:hypothetical protein